MTWRHVTLYFVVLLLVLAVVFELSLMYPEDGNALQWQPWQIA